jgi:hypothetical protein
MRVLHVAADGPEGHNTPPAHHIGMVMTRSQCRSAKLRLQSLAQFNKTVSFFHFAVTAFFVSAALLLDRPWPFFICAMIFLITGHLRFDSIDSSTPTPDPLSAYHTAILNYESPGCTVDSIVTTSVGCWLMYEVGTALGCPWGYNTCVFCTSLFLAQFNFVHKSHQFLAPFIVEWTVQVVTLASQSVPDLWRLYYVFSSAVLFTLHLYQSMEHTKKRWFKEPADCERSVILHELAVKLLLVIAACVGMYQVNVAV